MIDIVFTAWNRLEFTRQSFRSLLDNTNWELVDRVLVYDDGSTDGTREHLDEALRSVPVDSHLAHVGFGSPIASMNVYLDDAPAALFVKIDNDVCVPPGWLDAMTGVLHRHPEIELLGMESGFGGLAPDDFDGVYATQPCSHIGGVGLMRSSAFLSRPPMRPNGRWGFTDWQHDYRPVRAWISPELYVTQLDKVPVEPWASLSRRYIRKGWQREWPPYDAAASARYWDWIAAPVS